MRLRFILSKITSSDDLLAVMIFSAIYSALAFIVYENESLPKLLLKNHRHNCLIAQLAIHTARKPKIMESELHHTV
jgi:hypothetical protein